VIEDLLGHLTGVRGGIAGVYNVATTLDRQRRALADWSATLRALKTAGAEATGSSPASPANVKRLGGERTGRSGREEVTRGG
jgi:hypothetical protein